MSGDTISGHQFTTPPPPIEPATQYDQNPNPAPPCTDLCLYTRPSKRRCCCSLTFVYFRPPSGNTSTTALIQISVQQVIQAMVHLAIWLPRKFGLLFRFYYRTQWKANSDGGLSNLSKTENAHGNSNFEEPASPSIDDEGRESMEVQESENIPDVCTTKKVILKGFQVNG